MEISVHAGGTAAQKAQGIVDEFSDLWDGSVVVDVGCRSRDLETALRNHRIERYIGVDINTDAEVVADVGDRLPFDDQSADVVAALDVLEHTDNIHHAFAELCRIARRQVIITLPNCYEAGIRVRVLRGQPISKKYGLPTDAVADRHRWFFSLSEAQSFVEARATVHGWTISQERAVLGPKRARLAPIAQRWPDLLSHTYLVVLSRPQARHS